MQIVSSGVCQHPKLCVVSVPAVSIFFIFVLSCLMDNEFKCVRAMRKSVLLCLSRG